MPVLWGLAGALVVTTSCARPCESSANCQRECDCINAAHNNDRFTCPMEFRCEGATQTCEDAYASMSCNTLCATYGARNSCNLTRCLSDNECLRDVTCPVLDATNQPTGAAFNCQLPFTCDVTINACDAGFSANDAAVCDVCRQQATQSPAPTATP